MPRGWFSGPGVGVLDARYLMLDCTNDPLTAGLEVNAATAGEPVLILQTTDDNAANPTLEIQSSAGAILGEWQARGGLNFAAAVGQATPGLMGLAGARFLHTYGTQNLFAGVNAGNFALTGTRNCGLGEGALDALTSGDNNFAAGYDALGSNTSGIQNLAVGTFALRLNTTAHYSVAIGASALFSSTGGSNFAMGASALYSNLAGSSNFGLGYQALSRNTSGSHNVGIGTACLNFQTTAFFNVGIGTWANFYNQTGWGGVYIGYQAGAGTALHNKAYNVFIGYQAGLNEAGSNRLYLSNSNTATPLIYGEFDTWRLAFGNQYAVDKYGQLTHASGQFAAVGDAQDSRFVCRLAQASHAVNTWYALYPDGGTAPERLTIAAETGWTVHVIIIGITAAAAQQWGYEIIGLLERDGAGNTTLAGQTVRTIFESDANYDAQLAADDANEALEVQVRRTGGVDYDARWTASVRTSEVTYPA